MDGLLDQYKTIHTHAHTHTTHLSDGCIPRPPAVSAAFDDVFNSFIHPKAWSLFPFTLSSLSISSCCWFLGQLCAKWQLIPPQTGPATVLDSPPLLPPTLTLIPCSFSRTSYSWSVPFPILLKFYVLLRTPSVCHLPQNHIYMFHCHTLSCRRQLLSNPMRSSPRKHTYLTERVAFDQHVPTNKIKTNQLFTTIHISVTYNYFKRQLKNCIHVSDLQS